MLLKKVSRKRLADDPIPRKTFIQSRVLAPGRVSQSISLGRVSQPEGEVHSKVVVKILTNVLGVMHNGNVVFRELSRWADTRQHPTLVVSCVTLPKLSMVQFSQGQSEETPSMRKDILTGAAVSGKHLRR